MILAGKFLSLSLAARRAGKTPETIVRWCRQYGIGNQLHSGAPWRVSPVGIAIVEAGDGAALEAFRAGRKTDPRLVPYLDEYVKPAGQQRAPGIHVNP